MMWAGDIDHDIEEVIEANRKLGVKEEDLQKLKTQLESERNDKAAATEIWPEHADTVELFLALRTQWNRIGTFGGLIYDGLRYEVIKPTAEMLDIKVTSDVFNGLRIMESLVKPILNEKK